MPLGQKKLDPLITYFTQYRAYKNQEMTKQSLIIPT